MFDLFQGLGKNVLRSNAAKYYLPFVSFQEGHIGLSRTAKNTQKCHVNTQPC